MIRFIITSVKIKGVVHEFTTIPGVKEDLTDILLNLKSVALKVHSPGLKKMYIKTKGPGEITAGNFETDSETEIMNPNQILMTLDSNADIELEDTKNNVFRVSSFINENPANRAPDIYTHLAVGEVVFFIPKIDIGKDKFINQFQHL